MSRTILAALAVAAGLWPLSGEHARAAPLGRYVVAGVEGDDLLKMRAGPGTGWNVILGLPNGTVVQVHDCQQTGGTRWCEVSLDRARGLRGYVSWAYLRRHEGG